MRRTFCDIARAPAILPALVIILLASLAFAQPVINEVMPNPLNESDEWVEIWNANNDTLNLSEWQVGDSTYSDDIVCGSNCTTNATYFLILGNQANLTRITNGSVTYFFVDDTAIGNGLANDNPDGVRFFNTTYSTNMSYNSTTEGRSWAWLNSTWQDCANPTPGFANNCTIAQNQTNVKITMNLTSPAVVNATYSGIFNVSVENKSNCSALDNISVSYNVTTNGSLVLAENATISVGCNGSAGNWTPNATGEYALCGAILNSTANNSNASDDSACANITVVGESSAECELEISIAAPEILDLSVSSKLYYNITINDTTCNETNHTLSIVYWIDDLFGNTVKSPYPSSESIECARSWTNRQWTPDPISGSEAFLIKANISAPGCNDTDTENNYAERLFIVKANASAQSRINITDIDQGSDDSSKWGESFDVELELYRGNTSQYAITAYVRYTNGSSTRVSEDSTVHALQQYTTYKVEVPIRLKSNCDEDYPDGNYTLIVEGLNQSANRTVTISGLSSSVCQNVTVEEDGGGGGGGGGTCPQVLNASAGEDSNFYFVRAASEVGIGQTFETVVHVKNNATTKSNLTIYSYAFDGNTLLSEGKANETWQGGWEANVQTISLGAGESTNIGFMNKIKTNVTAGTYKLRVRIKDVKDLTRSLKITENATLEGCGICSCSAEPSESEGAENVTLNRTRRTINYEDPIEVIKNSVSEAITGFATSTADIARLVTERFPKPDFTLVPRIVAGTWEGFISAIEQIIRSS